MLQVFPSQAELAKAAATFAAERLRSLLAKTTDRLVRLLAATGVSQVQFLDQLTAEKGIDWKRIELFHLDEYVGLSQFHPASFARYIKERIIDRTGIVRYHLLDGTRDPREMASETGRALASARIDLAFVGIGENGHLAFNDPPADFEIEEPYLVVKLDRLCRQQQVGEGWFESLDEVPTQAITISIQYLLRAREILCIVPEKRKARAVKACFVGLVNPNAPASILRIHPNTTIFLDAEAASLLKP